MIRIWEGSEKVISENKLILHSRLDFMHFLENLKNKIGTDGKEREKDIIFSRGIRTFPMFLFYRDHCALCNKIYYIYLVYSSAGIQ